MIPRSVTGRIPTAYNCQCKEATGMAGIWGYRQIFISHLAQAAHPLHNLIKKGITWDWDRKAREALGQAQQLCTPLPQHRFLLDITKPSKRFQKRFGLIMERNRSWVHSTRTATASSRQSVATGGVYYHPSDCENIFIIKRWTEGLQAIPFLVWHGITLCKGDVHPYNEARCLPAPSPTS